MAILDMDGPYAFDQNTINQKVTKKSGNYALDIKIIKMNLSLNMLVVLMTT